MTALRSAAPAPAPVQSRVPRRVQTPRWLDLRLALGLLLVLGSVLLGARVLASADATESVWAAAGDLAPGTVLGSGDLVAVDVRLEKASGAYLGSSAPLDGRVLGRAVRRGELLPRSALEQPGRFVQVALPVQAGYLPPSLTRGQLVDVYALPASSSAAAAASAGSPSGAVALVVAGAPVQEVSSRAAGVLSAPTATVQIVVSVPQDRAAQVLGAIGGRSLAVVVHPSVDDGTGRTATGSAAGAAPSSASGPTG